jgi:[ribosomal protein S18]-alanine N-acetyltransferase
MPELLHRIRYFRTKDLEELHAIDRICFPADIAFSRDEILAYCSHPKSIAWVAEGLGKILGFILARTDSHARAHILTLDVIPDARRQKIGTMLMTRLHEELQEIGVSTVFLEVGAGNLAAQHLYQNLQYRFVGMLPGYYNGREDAYRMARLF